MPRHDRPIRNLSPADLPRLRRAREIVALHLDASAAYEPIFERMEAKIAQAEAALDNDPIARARRRIEARPAASNITGASA